MGIASTVNKWTYVLDGETLIFPYTTKIFAETDLVVQIVGTTTTTLTLTTNYSVSGTGEDSGGNVTLVSAGSSGDKLVIRKVLPLTQTTDLVENDPNRADVMENALDRMVLIAQQIDETVQRAVVRDVSQTSQLFMPTPSANKLIGWDSAGTVLENKTTLDADVQAACETAQTAAETAQGLAEDARDAAIVAQGLAEEAKEAAELIADLEVASEAEAQAGTNNTKMMTPLRTAQAITALQDDDIPSSYLDTDADLAADSDVKVPSQKAVKAYVDGLTTKQQLFTSNGTFTAPAGINFVIVTAVGGGGGGGANTGAVRGGGGGGGASVINCVYPVTPASEYAVVVGAGGAGASSNGSNGTDGGTSTFNSAISAPGGVSGKAAGTGGAGGVVSRASLNASNTTAGSTSANTRAGELISGGTGGNFVSEGGGGGASAFGNGGNGSGGGAGTAGSNYGGGGGGGLGAGGNGGDGFVLVTW
jgi:hypothetical protein